MTRPMRMADVARPREAFKIPFSVRRLAAIKPPQTGRTWVYDSETAGLGYQVTPISAKFPNGARTFYFCYRVHGGEYKRLRLGGAELAVDLARNLAKSHGGLVAKGIDPREEEKALQVARESKQLTLRKLWDTFYSDAENAKSVKPSTLKQYKALMEGPLKDWLDQHVSAITKESVLARHRKLGTDSGPAFANAAMRVLSIVFNFGIAIGKDGVTDNPTKVLRKRWFEVKRRTTKIADNQFPEWFKAIAKMRVATIGEGSDVIADDTARIGADLLEFTLFTGMRRNEACQMEWDRVDFEKRTVTVIDTKNDLPLVLPLSEHLLALLQRRYADRTKSTWCFPSPGRKGKAYFVEPRNAVERLTAICGIEHTIHDLRRTFVSAATRLVPHAVAKVLVNHASKSDDITQDYVVLSPDELRPHVETIAQFFLNAAKGDV